MKDEDRRSPTIRLNRFGPWDQIRSTDPRSQIVDAHTGDINMNTVMEAESDYRLAMGQGLRLIKGGAA